MAEYASAYRAAVDSDSTKKLPAGFPGISEYCIVSKLFHSICRKGLTFLFLHVQEVSCKLSHHNQYRNNL